MAESFNNKTSKHSYMQRQASRMKDEKKLFEDMSVGKSLATLIIPTVISQILTLIYTLADTYFIGKTDDPYKIAAVSVANVLFFIMIALSNLFGIGGGTLISGLLGKGERENARSVCAFSIYGAALISLIYSAICLIFMRFILGIIGAGENTFQYARSYLNLAVCAGGIPTSLSLTMSHLLRSFGHSRLASLGLGLGAVLNTILDPVFMFKVFQPGMEVTATAFATFLSNVATLIYFISIFLILRKSAPLTLNPKFIPGALRYTLRILSVGFSSALGSVLSCISNIVMNKLIFSYGDISLAAMGIVRKINLLPMNIGNALCHGMMPLAAYSFSSGNSERLKKTVSYTAVCGLLFTLICTAVFFILPTTLVSLFVKQQETVSLGALLLKITCLAMPPMFLNFLTGYTFQALGKGKEALLLAICRQAVINIPLLYLAKIYFGLTGIAFTQLITELLTLVISFLLSFMVYRKIKAKTNG